MWIWLGAKAREGAERVVVRKFDVRELFIPVVLELVGDHRQHLGHRVVYMFHPIITVCVVGAGGNFPNAEKLMTACENFYNTTYSHRSLRVFISYCCVFVSFWRLTKAARCRMANKIIVHYNYSKFSIPTPKFIVFLQSLSLPSFLVARFFTSIGVLRYIGLTLACTLV